MPSSGSVEQTMRELNRCENAYIHNIAWIAHAQTRPPPAKPLATVIAFNCMAKALDLFILRQFVRKHRQKMRAYGIGSQAE